MKKKFTFISLAVAICLGISGCNDDKGKAASNTSQPATTETKVEQKVEEVKAEAQAKVEEVKTEAQAKVEEVKAEAQELAQAVQSTANAKFREDYTSEDLTLPTYEVKSGAPGENTVIERSFENAPPLIPHNLDGLLPITTESNMCTTCHLPDVAEAMQIKSVPASHLADLRDEKQAKQDSLVMARYDCVACHVVQTDAKELVKINFEADFSRFKDSNTSSNLLDVLNQGAEIK